VIVARYDVGDSAKVTAVFTDPDTGEALDPDVVKLSVLTPGNSLTTYTYGSDAQVVKDSTGHFHALIDANAAGTWYYRWFSTGTGQAAEEKSFEVKAAHAV
jgi:hypothetical protein